MIKKTTYFQRIRGVLVKCLYIVRLQSLLMLLLLHRRWWRRRWRRWRQWRWRVLLFVRLRGWCRSERLHLRGTDRDGRRQSGWSIRRWNSWTHSCSILILRCHFWEKRIIEDYLPLKYMYTLRGRVLQKYSDESIPQLNPFQPSVLMVSFEQERLRPREPAFGTRHIAPRLLLFLLELI